MYALLQLFIYLYYSYWIGGMYDEFSIDICNTIIFIIKCRKLHIATHASGPKEIESTHRDSPNTSNSNDPHLGVSS